MSTTTRKGSKFRTLIIVLGVICLVVAGYSAIEVSRQIKNDQTNIQSIANLRVKTLSITQLAEDATSAEEEAFDALAQLNTEMSSAWL